MAGQYVTQRRVLPSPVVPQGLYGPMSQIGTPCGMQLPAGFQETYSWRTSKSGALDNDELDSRRIFRNGFTSNDPVYDRGHEFRTKTVTYNASMPDAYVRYPTRNTGTYWYRGPIIPNHSPSSYGTNIPYTDTSVISHAEMVTLGQRAILNTAPTAPQANAATLIGELFAGLPTMVGAALWKEQIRSFRGIGSEYLNVQFGWLPFLRDLQGIVLSLQKSQKILDQLQRDNGRVVRRRFAFPATVANAESNINSIYPYWSNPFSGITSSSNYSSLAITKITRTERSSWFSGAYSYMIPTDESLAGRAKEFETFANVILGSRVTPAVLWELAPWSWLVDWKFGIGRAISAASLFQEDGLVMRYGYLMVKTMTTTSYMRPEAYIRSSSVQSDIRIPPSYLDVRSEVKERRQSTPYGFGVSTDSLSDFQWSILAALGMTKGPRRLA